MASVKPKGYQFKATLIGSKPAIWRECVVPADYSFFDLHVALQDAFGWYDSHLHQFFTDNPYKRNSKHERIGFPTLFDISDVEFQNPKKRLKEYEKGFRESGLI